MKPEAAILAEIRLAVSRRTTATLFRNGVGQAYMPDGRVFRYGLVKGSSDLVGWTRVRVTQEMIGTEVAVFTAVEAKAAKGRLSAEQRAFLAAVAKAGGIAGVARSAEEAVDIVEGRKIV